MWGRPASQEELDTWEALSKRRSKRGKKWKMFSKKDKAKVSSLSAWNYCSTILES